VVERVKNQMPESAASPELSSSPEQNFMMLGSVAAMLGVPCLAIASFAHPMKESPADVRAAFAEYAADQYWIASHLLQLLGVVLITAALIVLSWRLRRGRAGGWALLGGVAAAAALALSGALQAVDGIALKVMVDRWASAPADSAAIAFEGAFAVRQIEIGLASMVILFFGLTAMLYAAAFLLGDGPRWLGWLALVSGAAMLVAGVFYAYAGFSDAAMMVSMPASLLLMLWSVAVAVFLFRSSREPGSSAVRGHRPGE
jgi:hypothetical protein